MPKWDELPAYQAEQSALILWDTLEQQRDPGVSWGVLVAMEQHLRALLPLTAWTVERRTKDGLLLRELVRGFSPSMAEAMLVAIRFPDLMQHLQEHGYAQTRETFIERACNYAWAQQSAAQYAR